MTIMRDDPIEITRTVYDGYSHELLYVEINGEKFIPQTNATRHADEIVRLLRACLTKEE